MDIRLLGTGGDQGWPSRGCRCASCMGGRAAGRSRAPGRVLLDGVLAIDAGQPPRAARTAGPATGQPAPGHQIAELDGGWEVTAPDGSRLLVAAGPTAVPRPAETARPFDFALLDLLHSPAQLGELRGRGLVHDRTTVAALYMDHRIASEQELARRARLWGVRVPADGESLNPGGAGCPAAAGLLPHRTLILGGARSGKSREAELRLAGQPAVTYLAAGPWPDSSWAGPDGRQDAEWASRVAAHQAARPRHWRTVESLEVARVLSRQDGAILLDGIGTWLAAVMAEAGAWPAKPPGGQLVPSGEQPAGADERIAQRADELVAAWRQAAGRVVAVSDQVGAGIVPATPSGRVFRDQLGWLNQRLAAESEETLLVIAGHVLPLAT